MASLSERLRWPGLNPWLAPAGNQYHRYRLHTGWAPGGTNQHFQIEATLCNKLSHYIRRRL